MVMLVGIILSYTMIISYPINIIQLINFITDCNIYFTYFLFEALCYKNNSKPLSKYRYILHENDNNTSSCTDR